MKELTSGKHIFRSCSRVQLNKQPRRVNISDWYNFRCSVQIVITIIQLVLTNVQNVVFFIGFERVFASIRRKMMLNILMQVHASHPPRDPSL